MMVPSIAVLPSALLVESVFDIAGCGLNHLFAHATVLVPFRAGSCMFDSLATRPSFSTCKSTRTAYMRDEEVQSSVLGLLPLQVVSRYEVITHRGTRKSDQ